MPDSTQTKSTKIMKIILIIGVGLTIATGMLSFASGGASSDPQPKDTFQSQESNPFQ